MVSKEKALKQDKRIVAFRELADAMQKDIDHKRNPPIGGQNLTRRRAGIIEGMAAEADRLAKVQAALRWVAGAVEAGELPECLAPLKTRAHVEDVLTYRHPTERLKKAGLDTEDKVAEAKQALTGCLPEHATDPLARKIRQAEHELIGCKLPGFFPTPRPVIGRLLELAGVEDGMRVLEPSAGKGDIVREIVYLNKAVEVAAVEVNLKLANLLYMVCDHLRETRGANVYGDMGDCLLHAGRYDRIVMNPPFENMQDAEHVRTLYERCLKPGGRLVSVMGAGVFFRDDAKAVAFREWLEEVGGLSEELPEGAFTGAGAFRQTGVKTYVVTIDKPAEPEGETVTIFTTAPKDYDGFSTHCVDAGAGYYLGKVAREVTCLKKDEEWQRARYLSGCHSADTWDGWQNLLKTGQALPPSYDADGLRCEWWPNRLGWTVKSPAGDVYEVARERGESGFAVEVVKGGEVIYVDTLTTPQDAVRTALALVAARDKPANPEPVSEPVGEATGEVYGPPAPEPAHEKFTLVPPNVAAVAKLTAKESRWGATTGVRVKTMPGRRYLVEATDGKFLGRVTGEGDDPAQFPTWPALEGAPNGSHEAYVPEGVFRKACGAAPKVSYRPELHNVAVVIGENVTTLGTTDTDTPTTVQPKNLDGRWPNTDSIFEGVEKDGPPAVTVTVDPAKLERLLEVARAFTTDDNKGVTLKLWGPTKVVLVEAKNGSGQEFRGVLVPMC